MRSLLCLTPEHKYYPVTEAQEAKISHLIQSKRLPDTFILGNETVVSSTILGFTDRELDKSKGPKGIKSMGELAEWAKTQPWYGKSSGRGTPPLSQAISVKF